MRTQVVQVQVGRLQVKKGMETWRSKFLCQIGA